MKQQSTSFSSNGKVSIRQMSRMMFLEIFGLATLVLPGPLAKICQTDGVFAIIIAAAIWSLFLTRYHGPGERKSETFRQETENKGDTSIKRESAAIGICAWFDTMKAILQILIFSLAGGFLMYLLVSLVERQLLDTSYLWIVILTIVVAGGYGIMKGVESRARIYEILFWILLVPLICILVIGLWNVQPDYWQPVFSCGWVNFFLGVAASMASFLPAALSILLKNSCVEPERVPHMAARTVWYAGTACAVVYLLLVGVFQADLLAVLKYPILSLMAVVEMPGNLLERLDAPMMIIWFFCLFALFHSLCYYGVEGIQRLFPKRRNRGRKVVIGMVLILTSALLLLLNGCGKKDPENNMYPLAVGIEYEKDAQKLKVAYAYPDAALGQSTGGQSGGDQSSGDNAENNQGSGDNAEDSQKSSDKAGDNQISSNQDNGEQIGNGQESNTENVVGHAGAGIVAAGSGYKLVAADSLFQAEELLAANSDQSVDLNHMKVFVVSREFLQNKEQKEQLFAYFLENENMAWNTCIVFTEDSMEELFSGDYANGKSLGFYLEDLLKSRDDLKKKSFFTVKDYMSLCKNENETMLVPLVNLRDQQISIDHYCILSRGSDRGILTATESSYARLLMNQQKTLPFLLDNDEYVTLQDLRLERHVEVDEEGIPHQKLIVKGNLSLAADWVYNSHRKEEILAKAREKLEWELTELIVSTQKEKHADLTNSFITLQGQCRPLWVLYKDNPEAYEKKLVTTVEVKLKMLET